MVSTLVNQVIIMFLLAGVGYFLFKKGKITSEGSKCIGNILIFVSLPCVIINGFLVERTRERIIGLGLSAFLAFVILLISILVSRLCFRKDAIAVFSASFSNPGFFGVPIIVSCLSEGAVFYIASFIAFLNLLQWTYGVSIIKGEKEKLSIKRVIYAPFMIAILIGCLFFFTGIHMPVILGKCISYLAGLNTPLAMFTIGVYLAQTDVKKMFMHAKLYQISLIRLVGIPILAILLLSLVPVPYLELKTAILIASACPVGSNVAVYAQLHNANYTYAVETVVISTLLAIVSMPGIVRLSEWIWNIFV